MAFVLPLFLLLTVGTFEFGRAWLTVNTVNHASREAVRLAVTIQCLTADDSAVMTKASGILAAAGLTGATVSNTAPFGDPPAVTVTVALNASFMTGIGPLLGFSFTGFIPVTGTATMRYERATCPP
jgi:Flp pilus assembly protein TadG